MARVAIWGRVEDADGDPPPRSIVYWIDGAHKGPALPFDLHPLAKTDEAGHFYAQDLPPGDCILVADCEAYGAGIQGARSSQGLTVTLPLPDGQKEVVLKYPLSRASFLQIQGTIVAGEDKHPLRGHRVVLLDPETSGRRFRMETDTDRDGEFKFAWIPPVKYSIGIPGTLGRLADGYNIQNALPAGVDIPLEIGVAKRPPGGPRHSAMVRCVDETGAPVAGAEVAFRAMNFHSLPVLAGEDGISKAEGFPVPLIGAMATKPGLLPAAGPPSPRRAPRRRRCSSCDISFPSGSPRWTNARASPFVGPGSPSSARASAWWRTSRSFCDLRRS
jgi:hypothetical protein